ncbi:DUF3086 domain-containing protein [Mastigocoleus testarum]|uniref:Small-conductance mechanosensitive channel n=1 Tax=Mastigocoleus testarum BC008 TaxID=371196 RepID=A0A0V7ZRV3_9CYAN|nr:DUF3086 domain-containing protein [Mastigocoleus testarum]KST67376.1 small-conductance mechanosensitive channel [Mastigocoleus testarum BC008]
MNQEEFENQKSIEESSEGLEEEPQAESVNPQEDSTPKANTETLTSSNAPETAENSFALNLKPQTVKPQDETSVLESGDKSQKLVNNISFMSVDSESSKISELQRQEKALRTEIANLQATQQILSQQVQETQTKMGRVVQEALEELEKRKQTLQIAVEKLEKRQERIRKEMRSTFAGASQDLAIRVQGFKDYLTGSLQDLAAAAEQLELSPPPSEPKEKPQVIQSRPREIEEPESDTPQFTQQRFQDTTKKIRGFIDQYRTKPDYYGPPWQLRRTFEPVHAERASKWFFEQGGRGALRTLGSRLQNTLVTSAIISILYRLYGDRVRTLILADSPERLGEWRRGLQDCLGVGRPDFGPDRGVALFETPEAVAQKAERLVKARLLPLIVIDDSEEEISLGLLEFPLWLAFAPDPKMMRNSYYDDDF